MRTSLSVEGGRVCASATKPIGRRTDRVEPGTRAGRQRIRPVTWITWQAQSLSYALIRTSQFIKGLLNKDQVESELFDALI